MAGLREIKKQLLDLPELKKGKGIWQNRHHEYDVYDHTLHVVRCASRLTKDPDLIAAACLHDIAKPATARKTGETWKGRAYHSFDDHEKVGEMMVRQMEPSIFLSLGLDQRKVARLVGLHYAPMKYIKLMRTSRNFSQYKSRFERLRAAISRSGLKSEVLILFLADKLGQGKHVKDRKELLLVRKALLGDTRALKLAFETLDLK